MNHKVLAIIGLAIILAASGGVVAATSGNQKPADKTDKPAAADGYDDTDEYDADFNADTDPEEVISDDGAEDVTVFEDVDEQSDATNAAPTSYDGTVEPSVPYEEQRVTATLSIQFVVDHSTGAETSARVVFGESYQYCYAAFDADKHFEICLEPASGKVRKGTYRIYNNVVAVEYDDGVGSEYEILNDENGNLTHVIVNYGDYDVYFAV